MPLFYLLFVKSVHFKKTVAQSSFLSKVLSFSLTLFWFQKKNDNTFERKEDCATVFLKWRDFKCKLIKLYITYLFIQFQSYSLPKLKKKVFTDLCLSINSIFHNTSTSDPSTYLTHYSCVILIALFSLIKNTARL